jgi:hypothetical protein
MSGPDFKPSPVKSLPGFRICSWPTSHGRVRSKFAWMAGRFEFIPEFVKKFLKSEEAGSRC